MTAEQFNELYPKGTRVRYYSIRGEDSYTEETTRSEAWELGDGSPVVLLEGRSGGFSIEHLRVIPQPLQ